MTQKHRILENFKHLSKLKGGGGEGGGRNKGGEIPNKGGQFTPLSPFTANTVYISLENVDVIKFMVGL